MDLAIKAYANIKYFQNEPVNIKYEENVTLLGVNINFLLNFDSNISDICTQKKKKKKNSKQLPVLKQIGRLLTKQGKLTIYNNLFIASNFNYCPVVGHFCSVASTNKMVKTSRKGVTVYPQRFLVIYRNIISLVKDYPSAYSEDEAYG